MELRHLEQFLAVADTGSFTQAASRCHVVQSAVSVSVRSLEAEMGAKLFDRTTRRVDLTDAGKVLVVQARSTLGAAEAAKEAVSAVAGGMCGTIRLGVMHSTTSVDLAGPIARFHRQRPLVRILPTTHPEGSTGLATAVVDNHLDVAIAAVDANHHPALNVQRLATEAIQLMCPPGHRLAGRKLVKLTELVDEEFIDVPASWGSRMSVDRLFACEGLRRRVLVEIADVANLTQLVEAGLGLALIAPSSAPAHVRAHLVPVRPQPVFCVSLLSPKSRAASPAVRAFLEQSFPGHTL